MGRCATKERAGDLGKRLSRWAIPFLLVVVLAPHGQQASAAMAADKADTLLVKYRDDSLPQNASTLPADFQASLLRALGTQFSIIGRARDGAFRIQLNSPLTIDQVRDRMNRISEDRAVLYTNIDRADATKATIARLSPNGRPIRQLIVKFRDQRMTEAAARDGVLAQAQLDRIAAIAGLPAESKRGTARGEYIVGFLKALTPPDAQAIASRIEQEPDVEYADPDYWVYPNLVPNDPLYATNQWHYMPSTTEIGGANLPAAWDISTGSASIIVGVIDTGALPNHPDLAGKYIGGYDFIFEYLTANDGSPPQPPACTASGVLGDPTLAPCILDRDSDASDPGDWLDLVADQMNNNQSWFWSGYCGSPSNSSWHGTHVSGTIGAVSNNATGVAGVNWNAKILPLRVLGKCGGYTSDINDAITWGSGGSVVGVPANPNVARVLNLSLGGSGPCGASTQAAINGALTRGTVVVISAGNNDDNSVDYSPGNCPNVISVAATQRQGFKSHYSNYGSLVQIAAPGGGRDYPNGGSYWYVYSTLNGGTTVPGSYGYVGYAGTSMAAPHVAGIASLMLSVDPSLTPASVLAKIRSTARAFPTGGPVCDTSSNPNPNSSLWFSCQCTTSICGAGIIDAAAAVAASVPPVQAFRKVRDFNADTKGDLLWRNAGSGGVSMWLMNGLTYSSFATLLTDPSWSITHTGDLSGDGKTDLVWRHANGTTLAWLMNGTTYTSFATLLTDPNWSVTRVADFNGDGKADLLWHNGTTGQTAIWLMNGLTPTSSAVILTHASWTVVNVGDFNGDGKADLVWRNAATGEVAIWLMNGVAPVGSAILLGDPNWQVTKIGDFNGDGKSDLVWRNSASGQTALWLMNGVAPIGSAIIFSDPNWQVTLVGDFDGDGKSDLVWRNGATGQTAIWRMNGTTIASSAIVLSDPNWTATHVADTNGDGKTDILWRNSASGTTLVWLMNGTSYSSYAPLLTDLNWSLAPADGL